MKTGFKGIDIFITMMLFTSMLLSQDSFEVLSASIQPNDTVYAHAGLVVTFSDPISIESLQAVEAEYLQYSFLDQNIVDSLRFFIQNSSNVTLNGQPLSFWYDKPSRSFVFLHESTPTMPEGTGIGFILESDNIFHLHDVTSESGDSLTSDLMIQFIKDDELIYNVVPNPYYGTTIWDPHPPYFSNYDPEVLFIHLPTTCTIILSTHDGIILKSVEHNGDFNDGAEFLSLKDNYGQVFPSGIYRWSIESEDSPSFNHGVLFALLPTIMSIDRTREEQPENFSITKIFPNPFNSSTNIGFRITSSTSVELRVVNLRGVMIWRKAYSNLLPGQYSTSWDMTNTDGVEVPSGIYFVQINSKTQSDTQKVTVLR